MFSSPPPKMANSTSVTEQAPVHIPGKLISCMPQSCNRIWTHTTTLGLDTVISEMDKALEIYAETNEGLLLVQGSSYIEFITRMLALVYTLSLSEYKSQKNIDAALTLLLNTYDLAKKKFLSAPVYNQTIVTCFVLISTIYLTLHVHFLQLNKTPEKELNKIIAKSCSLVCDVILQWNVLPEQTDTSSTIAQLWLAIVAHLESIEAGFKKNPSFGVMIIRLLEASLIFSHDINLTLGRIAEEFDKVLLTLSTRDAKKQIGFLKKRGFTLVPDTDSIVCLEHSLYLHLMELTHAILSGNLSAYQRTNQLNELRMKFPLNTEAFSQPTSLGKVNKLNLAVLLSLVELYNCLSVIESELTKRQATELNMRFDQISVTLNQIRKSYLVSIGANPSTQVMDFLYHMTGLAGTELLSEMLKIIIKLSGNKVSANKKRDLLPNYQKTLLSLEGYFSKELLFKLFLTLSLSEESAQALSLRRETLQNIFNLPRVKSSLSGYTVDLVALLGMIDITLKSFSNTEDYLLVFRAYYSLLDLSSMEEFDKRDEIIIKSLVSALEYIANLCPKGMLFPMMYDDMISVFNGYETTNPNKLTTRMSTLLMHLQRIASKKAETPKNITFHAIFVGNEFIPQAFNQQNISANVEMFFDNFNRNLRAILEQMSKQSIERIALAAMSDFVLASSSHADDKNIALFMLLCRVANTTKDPSWGVYHLLQREFLTAISLAHQIGSKNSFSLNNKENSKLLALCLYNIYAIAGCKIENEKMIFDIFSLLTSISCGKDTSEIYPQIYKILYESFDSDPKSFISHAEGRHFTDMIYHFGESNLFSLLEHLFAPESPLHNLYDINSQFFYILFLQHILYGDLKSVEAVFAFCKLINLNKFPFFNVRDFLGYPILHYALVYNPAMVRLFISHGALPEKVDVNGRSASALATIIGIDHVNKFMKPKVARKKTLPIVIAKQVWDKWLQGLLVIDLYLYYEHKILTTNNPTPSQLSQVSIPALYFKREIVLNQQLEIVAKGSPGSGVFYLDPEKISPKMNHLYQLSWDIDWINEALKKPDTIEDRIIHNRRAIILSIISAFCNHVPGFRFALPKNSANPDGNSIIAADPTELQTAPDSSNDVRETVSPASSNSLYATQSHSTCESPKNQTLLFKPFSPFSLAEALLSGTDVSIPRTESLVKWRYSRAGSTHLRFITSDSIQRHLLCDFFQYDAPYWTVVKEKIFTQLETLFELMQASGRAYTFSISTLKRWITTDNTGVALQLQRLIYQVAQSSLQKISSDQKQSSAELEKILASHKTNTIAIMLTVLEGLDGFAARQADLLPTRRRDAPHGVSDWHTPLKLLRTQLPEVDVKNKDETGFRILHQTAGNTVPSRNRYREPTTTLLPDAVGGELYIPPKIQETTRLGPIEQPAQNAKPNTMPSFQVFTAWPFAANFFASWRKTGENKTGYLKADVIADAGNPKTSALKQ